MYSVLYLPITNSFPRHLSSDLCSWSRAIVYSVISNWYARPPWGKIPGGSWDQIKKKRRPRREEAAKVGARTLFDVGIKIKPRTPEDPIPEDPIPEEVHEVEQNTTKIKQYYCLIFVMKILTSYFVVLFIVKSWTNSATFWPSPRCSASSQYTRTTR